MYFSHVQLQRPAIAGILVGRAFSAAPNLYGGASIAAQSQIFMVGRAFSAAPDFLHLRTIKKTCLWLCQRLSHTYTLVVKVNIDSLWSSCFLYLLRLSPVRTSLTGRLRLCSK